MGCDYYADENGVFEIEFYSYDTTINLGGLRLIGLKPGERISKELIAGKPR